MILIKENEKIIKHKHKTVQIKDINSSKSNHIYDINKPTLIIFITNLDVNKTINLKH